MCVFGGVQHANVVRLKCYLKSDVIKTGQSAIKAQFPYHVQVQGHKMATKKYGKNIVTSLLWTIIFENSFIFAWLHVFRFKRIITKLFVISR